MEEGKEPLFHVIYPEGDTPLQKWRNAEKQVSAFLDGLDQFVVFHHIVEERLGGFTGGMTTKQTLMALAAMNAVVSTCLSYTGEVMYIAPVTTKRIMGLKDVTLEGEDKKETVVRLARSSCPNFPYVEKKKPKKPSKTKVYPWVPGIDDMADAWLLAEAGLRVLRGEASIGRPEKTGRGKGKARRAKAGRPKEG